MTVDGAEQDGAERGAGNGAGHGEVGEELRLLALALLDRFEPRVRSVLAGLQVEAAEAAEAGDGEHPAACQWCPLCAGIAVLRGDRPELGGRIAEHADAALTVLRAVLEHDPVEREPAPAERSAAGHAVDGGC